MFFRDKNGHKVFTTKSDVWSASITMIHVLVGKQRKKKILDEVRITKYLNACGLVEILQVFTILWTYHTELLWILCCAGAIIHCVLYNVHILSKYIYVYTCVIVTRMIKKDKIFKQGIGIAEKSQETRRDRWAGNV